MRIHQDSTFPDLILAGAEPRVSARFFQIFFVVRNSPQSNPSGAKIANITSRFRFWTLLVAAP
jgi:hypothetical protein